MSPVIAAILIGLIIIVIQKQFLSPLSRIPNAHFTVPFSRLWLMRIRWKSRENRTLLQLHKRLGPVVRIGPREISVNCVDEGINLIYSSRFAKDVWYERKYSFDLPFMFSMAGNDEHRQRRKLLSQIYTKSHVLNSQLVEECLSEVLDGLATRLSDWATTGQAVEVVSRSKACMMDFLTAWIFGLHNGTDTLHDLVLLQDISNMFAYKAAGALWKTELPMLTSVLRKLGLNPIPSNAYTACEKLHEWELEKITKSRQSHQDESSPTASVYDHFYHEFKEACPQMSLGEMEDIIAAELGDHIVAGYDVGGAALAYTIYELSSRPELQRALRKELRTLDDLTDQKVAQRIDNLPLLDAVLTETLRLRPVNPGPWPRVVPDSGCRLAGKFDVPAGTIVSSTGWTLHRNPDVFPLPNAWRPERWLEADEDHLREMKRWFWAFGSGSRQCIGNHVATYVLKRLLVTIYKEYGTAVDENYWGNMAQLDNHIAGPIAGELEIVFYR